MARVELHPGPPHLYKVQLDPGHQVAQTDIALMSSVIKLLQNRTTTIMGETNLRYCFDMYCNMTINDNL